MLAPLMAKSNAAAKDKPVTNDPIDKKKNQTINIARMFAINC